MSRDTYEIVSDAGERAVLVGIDRSRSDGWTLEDDLAELGRLADTAGATVVGTITQRMDRPNPRTFIGAGKAEEVDSVAQAERATVIIFDDDLTPSQQANLEGLLPQVRVIDRTQLILDIFALHAISHEGKLQVELARLEYLLPRLRGMWGHLEAERLGGGKGARFGAGESQLESDRRLTRKRISELKRELKTVARARDIQRTSRARSGVFRIALVGYTNAGKSTLLNALTDAGVLVQDQLFATLDATTRKLEPSGRPRSDPHRHRRLHQQAAARARGSVQVHARRGSRGRPAAPRRGCLAPECIGADRGGPSGSRRDSVPRPNRSWSPTTRPTCSHPPSGSTSPRCLERL